MLVHRDAALQILIVDASPEDRMVYRRHLQYPRAGAYDVWEAETGAEGLAVCQKQPPDCVLLDYRLPDLDGLAFLTALAGMERGAAIPVIVLSGQGNETLAVDVMKAGAADYMPKPTVSAKALERAISNAVEQARLRAALEEQRRMLAQTNADLRRQHAEIRSFYHVLSHEMKTPLTVIWESVAIVLDGLVGPLTAQQRRHLHLAKDGCAQIALGLNDLLDAARLETGKLRITLRAVAIGAVVERAVAAMTPTVQAKGIGLQPMIARDLPDVWIDELRIAQVLGNLLSNAVKFSPAGGTVSVRVSPDPLRPLWVCVSVRDTGPGIEPAQRDSIFDRLYQVRHDDAGIEGGLGLGLYICRELVRLHGGEIWVESTEGQGSTFTFTLPTERAPDAPQP
jgi:two-component system, sensor histidine kinase and response regulator